MTDPPDTDPALPRRRGDPMTTQPTRRWLVVDRVDGDPEVPTFASEAGALACAAKAIQEHLEWSCGEWDEDVDDVAVAQVTHLARPVVLHEREGMTDEEWYEATGDEDDHDQWLDYRMEPVGGEEAPAEGQDEEHPDSEDIYWVLRRLRLVRGTVPAGGPTDRTLAQAQSVISALAEEIAAIEKSRRVLDGEDRQEPVGRTPESLGLEACDPAATYLDGVDEVWIGDKWDLTRHGDWWEVWRKGNPIVTVGSQALALAIIADGLSPGCDL